MDRPARPRRLLIIANRAAGRARPGRLDRVLDALRRRGCEVVVGEAGPAPGAIDRLMGEAGPDVDVIVAAGGDGTVNAVANALAGGVASIPRPIAVVPLGTVNLLAREIGMPRDPEGLAEVIATAPASPIWPGRIDDRLFLMVASAGIDAATVAAVDPGVKRRLGRLAFGLSALAQTRRYRRCEIAVRVDGVEHRAALVIAARGRFYAGPFVIAPNAALDDPQLHLLLLPDSRPRALLRYLAALVGGRLSRLPEVASLRCREATLRAAWPIPIQADGEVVGQLPVRIGVADAPLLLVRPPAVGV